MSKTRYLTRISCVFLASMLLCVFLTACSHSLSGKYIGEDGITIEFTSQEDLIFYDEDDDKSLDGTYTWDDEDKCYYLEIKSWWGGNTRLKAKRDGNNLVVTINGEEFLFVKK